MKFLMNYKGAEYFYTDKWLYAKKGEELTKLAVFDRHLFKLRLFNRIPILEIDGVRMHLVRDFKTPLDYSKEVVRELKIGKNDEVLDTCMGLGYTAIEAAKFARKVTTCELNAAVVALCKWNPWSDKLFSSSNVEMVNGDSANLVTGFKAKAFDVIIHDPPRFSHAPQLYSLGFYRELNRIMKPRGRLFHYVGSVGENKGRSISVEVANRLRQAGFNARLHTRTQGVFAEK
jgi:predicted methyltransferase